MKFKSPFVFKYFYCYFQAKYIDCNIIGATCEKQKNKDGKKT